MSTQALFLAWQDQISSRQWFPIGRLDADVERSKYRFRYTGGAERAQKEAGFPLAWQLSSRNYGKACALSFLGAVPAIQESSHCTGTPGPCGLFELPRPPRGCEPG